jgi:hypothetical protein
MPSFEIFDKLVYFMYRPMLLSFATFFKGQFYFTCAPIIKLRLLNRTLIGEDLWSWYNEFGTKSGSTSWVIVLVYSQLLFFFSAASNKEPYIFSNVFTLPLLAKSIKSSLGSYFETPPYLNGNLFDFAYPTWLFSCGFGSDGF